MIEAKAKRETAKQLIFKLCSEYKKVLSGRHEAAYAIAIKIRQSPTRFLKAVISPAFKDLWELKKTTSKKEVTPSPSHPRRSLIRLGLKIKISMLTTKDKTNR